MRALDDVIRLGKVRYVGASAYASWQLAHANVLAEMSGWTAFVVLQSEYNMLRRDVEREVLPYCRSHRVGFVPYYPLAGGFLTGKYEQGKAPPPGSRGEKTKNVQDFMTEANYQIIGRLAAWAKARGRGLNELAQAWLLAQPQVCSVISGATKVDQLESNVNASDWQLTSEEVKELETLLKSQPSSRLLHS